MHHSKSISFLDESDATARKYNDTGSSITDAPSGTSHDQPDQLDQQSHENGVPPRSAQFVTNLTVNAHELMQFSRDLQHFDGSMVSTASEMCDGVFEPQFSSWADEFGEAFNFDMENVSSIDHTELLDFIIPNLSLSGLNQVANSLPLSTLLSSI